MKDASVVPDAPVIQVVEVRAPYGYGARREMTADLPVGERDRLQSVPITQMQSPAYVWYVVGLLSVVNIFNYMDRMALSVLMPLIKADLKLSDGQLGLLVGLAFFLFYAICGIPVARWADRGIRRNIIAITLSVWSVMTALSGAAQNFWHLLLARVGLGVGEAGCIPSAQSIIADYVPLKRRAGVYAIHTFGSVVGTVLGLITAGWLGEIIGWRWTFVVLGLPGLLLAVLVRLTLREPVRGASDVAPGAKDQPVNLSLREIVLALWRCRTYRLLVFFFVASGFANVGLNQWWPTFYMRVHLIGLASVGIQLGLAIGIGSAIGTLAGGFLANKAGRHDVGLPILIGAAAIALSVLTALGSLLVSSPLFSIQLVCVTALLWGVPTGSVTAALYTVMGPWMRATGGAINIFFISIFGFGLGPFCVGMLSDALAPSFGAESLRYALLLPICFLVLVVIAMCAVARALPNDLKAAGVSLH